ncbi:LacI family DNA-binding transcriptional regulator [Castellaniella sp. GW247-6E4]|uniref:LacI family DNA-binding transcriptional regulator n=1 Tax=Castellaniella sp. GW247-6E4 TaxID=3140380 RepID=UPI00331537AC
MSNKSGPVTSVDVAKLAGVSQSAVSRTFTPGASVSNDMRTRVLAAASTLGYRPNAIARTLITKQSQIVAIVASYLENPFYLSAIEQLSKRLRKEGYCLLLLVSDSGEADEFLVQSMQYQADGVILVSTTLSSTLAQTCKDMGVPVVLFNRVSRHGNVNSVAADNYAGGRLAAQVLVNSGHRRLAFLAGLENTSTSRDREAGFRDELAALGVGPYQRAVGDYGFEQAKVAVRSLFEGGRRPDAIFAANDYMAIATMDCLRDDLGLRVPEDVSVLGFDDAAPSAWRGYQLTTIEQPAQLMVENAVTLLLDQMRGEARDARAVIAPVRLVVRKTVRGLVPAPDQEPAGDA